jgi:orotidine-5'-phosphate decarboxylase
VTGLIIALDDRDLAKCESLAKELASKVSAFKVGLTLFAAHGPEAILEIGQHAPVFCDLKYHDIPSQVGAASAELVRQGVWMFTVHASGGSAMMRSAVEAAAGSKSLVAGVTLLTSLSRQSQDATDSQSVADQVERLALLAVDAGAGALVASGEEIARLRRTFGESIILVAPGIRPEDTDAEDQARVATPAAASKAGADHIVVGRSITRAADPIHQADLILKEIAG